MHAARHIELTADEVADAIRLRALALATQRGFQCPNDLVDFMRRATLAYFGPKDGQTPEVVSVTVTWSE